MTWILLDQHARTPEQAFPGAYSAELWHPADFEAFARDLLPALELPHSPDAHHDLVTALRLLTAP